MFVSKKITWCTKVMTSNVWQFLYSLHERTQVRHESIIMSHSILSCTTVLEARPKVRPRPKLQDQEYKTDFNVCVVYSELIMLLKYSYLFVYSQFKNFDQCLYSVALIENLLLLTKCSDILFYGDSVNTIHEILKGIIKSTEK